MKKIAHLLLICIYSLSITGIGVSQFYCCGKLKQTSLAYVQHADNKCGIDKSMSGCCKTKVLRVQLKDSHIAGNSLCIIKQQLSNAFPLIPYFLQTTLGKGAIKMCYSSHSPPEYTSVPIYILHCAYRI